MLSNSEKLLFCCLTIPLNKSSIDYIKLNLTKDISETKLWDIACKYKVLPIVADALQTALGIQQLSNKWRSSYKVNKEKIDLILRELDNIGIILSKEKIDVIILENGAIAKAVYNYPASFDFGDIDLLFKKNDLINAAKILIENGYTYNYSSNKPNGHDFLTNGRIELSYNINEKIPYRLNLQSVLVAHKWFNYNNDPGNDILFPRSFCLPRTTLRILNNEDFLYQLCIHNASHGYFREPGLKLHLDIDIYLWNRKVNWANFVDMVKSYDACTKAYYSLLIPNILFGTHISQITLDQLEPSYWKKTTINFIINKEKLKELAYFKISKYRYIILKILLYDKVSHLISAIFPDNSWMKTKYKTTNRFKLLLMYILRLLEIYKSKI